MISYSKSLVLYNVEVNSNNLTEEPNKNIIK